MAEVFKSPWAAACKRLSRILCLILFGALTLFPKGVKAQPDLMPPLSLPLSQEVFDQWNKEGVRNMPSEALRQINLLLESPELEEGSQSQLFLYVLRVQAYQGLVEFENLVTACRDGLKLAPANTIFEYYLNKQLASAYRSMGDWDSVKKYQDIQLGMLDEEAAPIEGQDKSEALLQLDFEIGESLLAFDRFPEATKHYKKLYKKAQREPTMATYKSGLAYQIGIALLGDDNPKEAMVYFRQSHEISLEDGNPFMEFASLNSIVNALMNLEQYEDALALLPETTEALYRIESGAQDTGLLEVLVFNTALSHYQLEHADSALQYFQEYIQLITPWQGPFYFEALHRSHRAAAHLFRDKQEWDSAYAHAEIAMMLQDSISFYLEDEEKTAELIGQINEALEKKELAESEQEKTYLWGGLLGAVLLLLLAASLIVGLRRTNLLTRIQLQQREAEQKRTVLDLLNTQEKELLSARIDGQDRERERIAADLHDSLGGTLAAIQVSMGMISGHMEAASEGIQKNYQKASELINEASVDVRRISHDMADNVLRGGGLSEALYKLKGTIEDTQSFEFEMEIQNMEQVRMDGRAEMNLYRVIQELVQNVIKHSKATHVNLQVSRIRRRVNVILEDNGIGFDPGQQSQGMGMRNLHNRIEAIGGRIMFDSQPNKGTTVTIDIPNAIGD